MSLTLSREEIQDMTGRAQRETQRKSLDTMGVPYRVNMDGWPVVLRSAAIKALGGDAANDDRVEATIDMGFLDQ